MVDLKRKDGMNICQTNGGFISSVRNKESWIKILDKTTIFQTTKNSPQKSEPFQKGPKG